MKKLICMLLMLVIMLGCGCAKKPAQTNAVDLMPNADPETSALALYVYDGQTITCRYLFEDTAYRAKVMEDFHNANARETVVDVTMLKPPFYGIEMGAGDLGVASGLWSDGYFIAKNGKTYTFEYDFEAFLDEHPWDEADTFHDLAIMPCADLVAKTPSGWNTEFLTPADEPVADASGIVMDMQLEEDLIQVQFTNNGAEEWGYGYDYGLHVLLNGTWYFVPAEQEMAFIEVLCMLPVGATSQETYSLAPYGDLPAGTYRFVTQGLAAEFTVE